MANLWDFDSVTVSALGIDVPSWIEQDITPYDVAGILQGGCASGAYMPAVTYHMVLRTMQDYGDDILEAIQDVVGEVPAVGDDSWGTYCCNLVSTAVELWASSVESEIETALDEMAEESEE